jgi:integrase
MHLTEREVERLIEAAKDNRRVKQGTPATHPLTGRELRALRRLQREQGSRSPFVFVSERGTPFSPAAT